MVAATCAELPRGVPSVPDLRESGLVRKTSGDVPVRRMWLEKMSWFRGLEIVASAQQTGLVTQVELSQRKIGSSAAPKGMISSDDAWKEVV